MSVFSSKFSQLLSQIGYVDAPLTRMVYIKGDAKQITEGKNKITFGEEWKSYIEGLSIKFYQGDFGVSFKTRIKLDNGRSMEGPWGKVYLVEDGKHNKMDILPDDYEPSKDNLALILSEVSNKEGQKVLAHTLYVFDKPVESIDQVLDDLGLS